MRAASTRRYYHNAAALQPQLCGGGGPKPSPNSNEEPLIKGSMRTFPTMHPSLPSVKNLVATGCPAIVHSQMSSSQWKSTYQATISNSEPTIPKRKEGKAQVSALFGAADLYTEPVETYVAPPGAPPTIYRVRRARRRRGAGRPCAALACAIHAPRAITRALTRPPSCRCVVCPRRTSESSNTWARCRARQASGSGASWSADAALEAPSSLAQSVGSPRSAVGREAGERL